MQVRPSTKFIKLSYALSLMLAAALGAYLKAKGPSDARLWWILGVPVGLILLTAARHIGKRLVKLEITGDRLRYEAGLLSKSTRTLELAKVQDVRVDQTLGQRIAGVGDLSFETAGTGSRIVIRSIDRPQLAADQILELAKAQRAKPDAGNATPPAHDSV
ncbi:MAG TPA: PH domain-containing protein [Bryobacteraceae bacterium]|nr:PH domain-containing protein [Bryobacteraceae bacterium]